MDRFRNHEQVIPKVVSEFIALGFVLFIIPAIYIFEVCTVLPAIYDANRNPDASLFWMYFHSALGTFIMFNLVGNLVGVILVDTSTNHTVVVDQSQVM